MHLYEHVIHKEKSPKKMKKIKMRCTGLESQTQDLSVARPSTLLVTLHNFIRIQGAQRQNIYQNGTDDIVNRGSTLLFACLHTFLKSTHLYHSDKCDSVICYIAIYFTRGNLFVN